MSSQGLPALDHGILEQVLQNKSQFGDSEQSQPTHSHEHQNSVGDYGVHEEAGYEHEDEEYHAGGVEAQDVHHGGLMAPMLSEEGGQEHGQHQGEGSLALLPPDDLAHSQDLQQHEGGMDGMVGQDMVLVPAEDVKKKKKRKLKHLELDLDPLAHQKLMKLVSEQHDGSLEQFLAATVTASHHPHKTSKKASAQKKPALTKWKRIKFEQLKGGDTQELAQAYRALVDSTQGTMLAHGLIDTPWEDLTIPQLEKMLDDTKRMLQLTEKVHDCPHPNCGRRFATPGNLRDHLNEHSGDKPYICSHDHCGTRFSSKQLLCRHMKKHERAHICTYEGCGKRFAFRERLVVHQKIHSDERPLTCPWEGCGKTFKWANSLHGHMRTHTGEKPFQCTFSGCGRLFGYKVDLTRHIRTHYGQPARLSH